MGYFFYLSYKSLCCCAAVASACAAALTLVIVVVNVSVVCTIAVADAVIVTGMYPLSTHATTVVIAMENVDMTKRLIIYCYVFCEAGSALRSDLRIAAAVA